MHQMGQETVFARPAAALRQELTYIPLGKKLRFTGVRGDVYNITAPFKADGRMVIAGRIEGRDDIAKSHVCFFEEAKEGWRLIEDAPVFPLEDGFVCCVRDTLIFGGVEVTHRTDGGVDYRTVFYCGDGLSSLKRFMAGPERMKDVRLAELPNGRIAVFTRPQGHYGGRGKIGYAEVRRLEELTPSLLQNSPLFDNMFLPEEWGGANELHVLKDGRIGVLGHVAYFDEDKKKHYCAMTFVYAPESRQVSPIRILATRQSFPAGEAKAPDLVDVIFPGGLVRHGDGTATLYAGLSDAEAGSVLLPDPFSQIESV